jgi:hypothetical protein
VGTHSITALFNQNGVFGTSKSSASSVTISAAAASLIPTVTAVNWDATQTSAVASVVGGSGQPGGTVTFLDGGSILGTVSLGANGNAVLTIAAAKGEHHIYASFAGNASFAPSVSPVLEESSPVGTQGFTLVADKVSLDDSESLLLQANAMGGPSDEIRLACASLPHGYSCAFAPPSLAGSGTSRLTIELAATSSNAAHAKGLAILPQFALALCFVAGFARTRKLGLLVLFVCISTGWLACGTAKAPARNSVVTVTATQQQGSSSVVRSVQVVVHLH